MKNPVELYKNISHFIEIYGGKAPGIDSPKALDVLSDYILCMGCEFEYLVKEEEMELMDRQVKAVAMALAESQGCEPTQQKERR